MNNIIAQRAALVEQAATQMGKDIYKGTRAKEQTARTENQKEGASSKVCTLEEAIRKSGLKDGMTISFHHHFRAGD